MNGQKIFNSEKYLKKIFRDNNGKPNDGLEAAMGRLSAPLGLIDYKENDSVALSTEGAQLSFEYSPINKESRKIVEDFLEYIKKHKNYADNKFLVADEWREIQRLKILKNKVEDRADLEKITSFGYKIFFFPSKNKVNGWAYKEAKSIFIIGDMAAPITVVTLLHEIGHAYDFENLDKMKKNKLVTDGIHDDKAEELRRERVASAFALKAITPLFSKKSTFKRDALTFLKYYALESYNDSIKQALASHAFMHHTMGKDVQENLELWEKEEREQIIFEEFIEWRKTEEYKKWKELEKYRDADQYEEYGFWKTWCEKNEKAWWVEE
jgi:hypothetical protein